MENEEEMSQRKIDPLQSEQGSVWTHWRKQMITEVQAYIWPGQQDHQYKNEWNSARREENSTNGKRKSDMAMFTIK